MEKFNNFCINVLIFDILSENHITIKYLLDKEFNASGYVRVVTHLKIFAPFEKYFYLIDSSGNVTQRCFNYHLVTHHLN